MKRTTDMLIALRGLAMGIAEVIPGVSGGTIAFITGIYERLLASIKQILGPELWQSWRQGGFIRVWSDADGRFLLALLMGMAAGIVIGVFGVSHLMERYPVLLWAFFFGLIIASSIFIARQITRWGVAEYSTLALGTALAFYITIATPAQGTDAHWFVFLSGVIAISALILPGLSGSFVLLLLGMYTTIIGTLKKLLQHFDVESLITIVIFALGCLLGLATFSRILSWMFKTWHNLTLALLTGFMLGSLNKVWPWRQVVSYRTNSKGIEVPFLEKSVLPSQYISGDPMLAGALACMVLGVLLVWWIERTSKPQRHV
ncbi:MAG TPA: DUF368 domain-containing protein [Saprospiraceae bacterium]|nr:DUF368 domain-containing protein [Saprospiraceae bacterium]HMP12457.1 DUF368 domain-containing protein [Saprospiraceae bacterium]